MAATPFFGSRCRHCGERIASHGGPRRSARPCPVCGARFAGYPRVAATLLLLLGLGVLAVILWVALVSGPGAG